MLLTFISFIYTWDYYDRIHTFPQKNYEKQKKIVIFEKFEIFKRKNVPTKVGEKFSLEYKKSTSMEYK